MNGELAALEALDISTALTWEEVWKPVTSYHVDGLHPEVFRRLGRAMSAVERAHSPIATVVRGESGSGKTHLLGWTRHEIQERGGFFFYIKLVTGRNFYESAAESLVDSLYRRDEGDQEQLTRLLDELSRQARLDTDTRAAVTGRREVTRAHVDAFVRGIRTIDRQVGNEAADTARALVLIASAGDPVEIGRAYFALNDDDGDKRAAWGMSPGGRPAQLVLRDLTRLFALAGPLVFAFDQLDTLVSAAETSSLTSPASGEGRAAQRLSGEIANGLMELREEARRTLMVVACHEDTWERISRAALRSALDRFEVLPTLGAIPDEATAAAIVSSRFRTFYERTGFTPRYPTWPVTSAALAEAPHRYTARRLLVRVQKHIEACLRTGTVSELNALADAEPTAAAPPAPARAVPLSTLSTLSTLTESFDKLRAEADDRGPLDPTAEDRSMPSLLGAGLRSLVRELGVDETWFSVETDFGRKAALHARLRYVVDEASENEFHWSFRAIAADNAIAAQNRIRNAAVEAGLTADLASRRLTLLRNTPYPSGPRTKDIKDDFEARGGVSLPIGAADLRALAALRTMLDDRTSGLDEWLRQERPASRIEVFAPVLGDLRQRLGIATTEAGAGVAVDAARTPQDAEPARTEIVVGTTVRGGRPFAVPMERLRMHTAVVGATGSGKTVLIKRLVEQCALRGVSVIVLDPNDDLARLGDPWSRPPEGWTDDHEREARRYFADVEVVVWTPGLNRGRPISFHPLPDFGPVLDDEDDFPRLVRSTVASLAPHAGVRGSSARATQQLGVLKRALERYARDGGKSLAGLVELLAERPTDIVNSRTSRFAVQMADTLEAAMETDPLFGESGAPADPGLLLIPSPGKVARISVINFIGLSGDGPAQFVSRLQATLFSWFRAHPVGDRALGGLLVMDEAQNFVPAGASNPSRDSTVELIRQIRKYGLGMVLASQLPRGIHNQALGNTVNQFIGRLTQTAHLEAVRIMAQARNAVLDNLAGLEAGVFNAASEGTGFSKIEVPICLSHHDVPLKEDEIVERARRGT
ncbi:helicase HerA domain-containing protein [Streptomyces sp. CRN 30]|uniref:helicase HerA domain-containing protein n=1 Tax=Streptomyces sp. CRN 30 TaxID=3075613 RepID=UPI002A7F8C9C|nr:helicase HerA-like domain-containing protein [Streptomyces sp. CRN 30]